MQPYNPFQYPPNYQLAKLHKQSSMPGSSLHPPNICPCCNKKQKKPFTQWFNRSIQKDFNKQGGSVITYFWLLKLYISIIGFILIFYGAYLTYLIQTYCSQEQKQCQRFLGLWLISNQDFIHILRRTDENSIIRLLTLRGISFVILMITNGLSLIVVKMYRKVYPSVLSVKDYSVVFKNVKMGKDRLVEKLKGEYPEVEVKQMVDLKSLEPFCTLNKDKMTTYYQILNCHDEKQLKKLQCSLVRLSKKCEEEWDNYYSEKSQRILIVFNTIDDKQKILKSYTGKNWEKIMNLLGMNSNGQRIYCQSAPKPEQILWNNIGSSDEHKVKYKIISVIYFIFLLAANYALFFLCMQMIYNQWLQEPWNTIFINVILTLLVFAALTFRANMNKLSQLSHPSTYTARTMFIVLTTISFHLLFYIIIPTFYFSWSYDEHKTQILKMISNQVLNFVIFQFIIVGIDLMHYNWNKRLKIIQNQDKPFACQKILHENIEYPRFPIEFKLIILYKLWSFTIFFAFQSPLILFFIFITLLFLFFKDKHSLYFHYRMQIIDNKVQFNFLRIYSTFFSIYMCTIFLLTQHLQVQFWLAIAFTIFMILIQLLYLGRNFQDHQTMLEQNGTLLLPPCYDQLDNPQSYTKLYQIFKSRVYNKELDDEINQYLGLYSSDRNNYHEEEKQIKTSETQNVIIRQD